MLIDNVRAYTSQFNYTDIINMNLISVATPPYIYHGCSTQKTLWEEKVRHNVRKHREIKNSEKYINLEI